MCYRGGVYGKLFSSMYDGSLAMVGPWEALVTFQQMIILADYEGFVDMTAEAISRRTIIPLEIIKKGIEELERPDPQSRDSTHEGRRIERISDDRTWGWKILNYTKYRQIRNAEERRAYMRDYMKAKRSKKAASKDFDTGEIVERIPMIGGEEFEVRESFSKELERLYPNVDIPATLKQMRGWCIGNPTKLKTPRGIRKFITGWCERDQNGR